MSIDCTIVCGVDRKHLDQLSITWPTWRKNKPSLLEHPMLVFYDIMSPITRWEVRKLIDHPNLTAIEWPPNVRIVHHGNPDDKWTNPQRYKMLAGFVYASSMVRTEWMLKLDTDVVAAKNDDWINPDWFVGDPAIVSHPWSFTKPKDQMLTLDRWVSECRDRLPEFEGTEPLNLVPRPEKDRLGHKRIISWCSFFRTSFVRMCASMAQRTCGYGMMPVPSQDGYLWYCAKRLGHGIVRPNMKNRGWQQWSTWHNITSHASEAMK